MSMLTHQGFKIQMLWSDPYGGDHLPMATQGNWMTALKNVSINQGASPSDLLGVTDPSFKGYYDNFRPYRSVQISWKLLHLRLTLYVFIHFGDRFPSFVILAPPDVLAMTSLHLCLTLMTVLCLTFEFNIYPLLEAKLLFLASNLFVA